MKDKRESFNSRWGFILACIGSAVGMGNIWMFPTRVSLYGGGSFLIPYFIFVVVIASTGVIGEMSFGRAARSGPIDAFDEEEERISYEEKTGVLGNDKSETIKKINFKKMDAMTLETYVKAGKRLRYKGLTPKRNENIEIFITSQKNFKGIKVGIIDSQNRIRYIQDRGRDLVEHRFKIEKEGKYDVFIEMEDKKDVKIVGMINIDDD